MSLLLAPLALLVLRAALVLRLLPQLPLAHRMLVIVPLLRILPLRLPLRLLLRLPLQLLLQLCMRGWCCCLLQRLLLVSWCWRGGGG